MGRSGKQRGVADRSETQIRTGRDRDISPKIQDGKGLKKGDSMGQRWTTVLEGWEHMGP
jgi:hypothetical protein